MPIRTATAKWEGTIEAGSGTISVESGRLESPYSFGSRFESEPGTNPEELLGAAEAGCFTMALSLALSTLGHRPSSIETTASVGIEKESDGFRIPRIDLHTVAVVPGIDEETFRREAESARLPCIEGPGRHRDQPSSGPCPMTPLGCFTRRPPRCDGPPHRNPLPH